MSQHSPRLPGSGAAMQSYRKEGQALTTLIEFKPLRHCLRQHGMVLGVGWGVAFRTSFD